jgi:hypothetical protein
MDLALRAFPEQWIVSEADDHGGGEWTERLMEQRHGTVQTAGAATQ